MSRASVSPLRPSGEEQWEDLCPAFVPISQIEEQPINFLWRPWLPLGTLTIITGTGGLGKSTVMLDIAARISVGGKEPCDDTKTIGLPGRRITAILSSEDKAENVLKPRLRKSGAAQNSVLVLPRHESNLLGSRRGQQALLKRLHSLGHGLALVIIDAFKDYLPADWNDETAIRPVLHNMREIAEELDVAMVAVVHPPKSDPGGIAGSAAFFNSSRSVISVAVPTTGLLKGTRLFRQTKSNYAAPAKALAYQIKEPEDKVVWLGKVDDVEDQLAEDSADRQYAKYFLQKLLANGPVAAKTLYSLASEEKISGPTLRRVRADMGYRYKTVGFGTEKRTFWFAVSSPGEFK